MALRPLGSSPSRPLARPRVWIAALVATCVMVGAGPASAQAQGRDPAAAEALFRAGLTALDQGDWDGACARFEASMQLDPSAGTSINVARCLERSGRLAAAWAEMERARVLAREEPEQRRREVEAYVEGEVRRIEPRIPRLRIVAAALPPGAAVQRDGIPLDAGALGVPLPVDPGSHVVEATAPGHRPGRWVVAVAEGAVSDVSIVLEPIPGGAFAAPGGDDAFAPRPPPADRPAEDHAAPLPFLGIALVGVGVASLAVGTIAGIGAIDAKGDIEDLGCDHETLACPSPALRDQAQSISDRGGTMSTVSTIGFVAGGLFVAAGATLLIIDATDAPASHGTMPSVAAARVVASASPDGAGLTLRGALW